MFSQTYGFKITKQLIAIILFFSFQLDAQNDYKKYLELSYADIDSLAGISYQEGDYKSCILYSAAARENAKAEFGAVDSTYVLYTNNLGVFYYFTGQFERSVPLYLEALKLDEALNGKERSDYAVSLNNIATLFMAMGKYEEAEAYYLEGKAIKLKALGKKHPSYASSLNSLGALYFRLGKYEQAEPLYLEAKDIFSETVGKEHRQYAITINNLATLYNSQKKFLKAEKLLLEALAIKGEVLGKEHPKYAGAISNLASFYKDKGNLAMAEKYFIEAKQLFLKSLGKSHPSYASSLDNLANLYQLNDRNEEAFTLYLQAKEIRQNILGEVHPDYFNILNNIAASNIAMKDFEIATHYLKMAITLNDKSKTIDSSSINELLPQLAQKGFYDKDAIIGSLEGIYELCLSQYAINQDALYLNLAAQAIQEAIQLNEQARNNLSGERDKLRRLKQTSSLVEKAIALSVQLQSNRSENTLNKAFYSAEQNKSVLLSEALKGQRAKILGDLPDSLTFKEMDLQKELRKLQKTSIEALGDSAQLLVQIEMNDLNERKDAFLKKLKTEYPKYHQLKYKNNTVDIETIQKELDEKSLLLEFFVADTISYVFAISKQEVKLIPIQESKKALKAQIKNLRKALSNYNFIFKKEKEAYDLYTRYAYQLYDVLLKEALSDPLIENLIIVTDGDLGHIPFEALLVEFAPQAQTAYSDLPYLIREYTISYNYSASLWHQNNIGEPKQSSGKMLACAATYNNKDSSAIVALRSGGMAKLRGQLSPLPEVQKEIGALSHLFQGDFLVGEAANERFFKSHAKEYDIIHLAMHGILHPRIPILSSLAFTDNLDTLEDNFLQAYEISQLQLNASLIVLSACETGYGKFEQGEGIISLARSFMYAGTPALVVSLWQVNDYATSEIMKKMYTNFANGMNKDEALRQAKLAYMKGAEDVLAHPAFWSPFVIMGNTEPVSIKTKGGLSPWGIGGLAVLILGGGWMFSRRRKERA